MQFGISEQFIELYFCLVLTSQHHKYAVIRFFSQPQLLRRIHQKFYDFFAKKQKESTAKSAKSAKSKCQKMDILQIISRNYNDHNFHAGKILMQLSIWDLMAF